VYLAEYLMQPEAAVNPYNVHKVLWSLFPDMPEASRPFLYRMSPQRRGRPLSVLLCSSLEPVVPGPGSPLRLLRGPRPFAPCLRAGDVLRFSLCANPVKQLNKERCRVPLVKDEERRDWLQAKLGSAAQVLESQVVAQQALHFRRGGKVGKIVAVTFSGVLLVQFPESLAALVRSGVGRAKAFGCGLLTLGRM